MHPRVLHHLATGLVSRSGRILAVLAAALLLPGCGANSSAAPTPSGSDSTGRETATQPPVEAPAHVQLAALAAAAEDRSMSAIYTLSAPDRPDRSIAVTLAVDGSWRVDIPNGALGGTAGVAVAQTADGIFQCALPAPGHPVAPACVRVADPGGRIPSDADPRVQHLFTSWVRALSDRQAPLSVSAGKPLPGATGSCFSVESISASLNPPLEVGIYCYAPDGTLTAARVSFGTLVLVGTPGAAPPTVSLPGPVVTGAPLSMGARSS